MSSDRERTDAVLDELTKKNKKIERLQFTTRMLAGHIGYDISELVEDGFLENGDMD